MKILIDDKLKNIREIISSRTKYQKVLLIYDDYVTNQDIKEIYDAIKDICVFNKCYYNDINSFDVYDGYRLIIYHCSVENMNFDIRKNEFVSIFLPNGDDILEYLLDNNGQYEDTDSYLITTNQQLSLEDMSSMCFMYVTSYFDRLINHEEISKPSTSRIINKDELLTALDKDSVFVDRYFFMKYQINYNQICLVDFLLVDALLLFVKRVKNKTYSLVDIYKECKDDEVLIEKFYKLSQNTSLLNYISLSYVEIETFLHGIKHELKEILSLTSGVSEQNVDKLIFNLKDYSKNATNFLAYLYLYNIFED